MRSDRIYTNRSCNQNCTYCTVRSASDDPRAIAGGVMRRRVEEVISRGVREIVFTGGEPTMRRDLADLVRYARARGAERVVVETNGTLVDEARARELSDAGVGLFRVNLAGFGDALDAVTRDPGGFRRTLAGLLALSGTGSAVEIAAAIVRSTAPLLPDLPAGLARALGGGRALTIVLSTPIESPERDELVPYEEAASVIARVDQAARAVGVRLRLAPDHRPPPCCFPHPGRVAHAFTLAPGGAPRADHARVEACASCAVADRCDGFPAAYLARRPPPPILPVTEDRLRRRLSLATPVDEQIAHELVTRSTRRSDGVVTDDHIVRVNFHCNQACEFCFVSTHLPPAAGEAVSRAIEAAGRGGARVTLSGGEPTLNPRLAEYVRLARASSRWPVEIQTNAVLLDDPERVRALVEAGLSEAFVSLHAATAETSDAVTGAPGTFARTVAGVDNLRAAGVRVTLNFVICQANHAEIVPYVRMVAGRWPGARVSISFVSSSRDIVPQTTELVPRYSDALPHLAAALDEARRLGVDVVGFESMCGLPLCLVPSGQGAFAELPPVTDGDDDVFVKPEPCARCALASRCYGVRRRYVELHGSSELSPVPACAAPPALGHVSAASPSALLRRAPGGDAPSRGPRGRAR